MGSDIARTCTWKKKAWIFKANYVYFGVSIITPRVCARGKVIGRVVVVVSTKNAIFQDTGI